MMHYQRMAIEKEAPEEIGAAIRYNLSESAVGDKTLDDLGISIPRALVLSYTEHQGSSKLRQLISTASNSSLTPEDILVTAGASTSLFIIATSLLSSRDHLIVTRPNYATNLETPRAIGCDITFIDLHFHNGFRLDIEQVAAAIRPGATKLISICSPNNPAGTICSALQIRELSDLARKNGIYLLVDETYADLSYPSAGQASQIPPAASLGQHVIGVSSMSKVYGVPGIRIGWLTCTNTELQRTFLAAKEQISISGSVLDEFVAEQILSRRDVLIPQTRVDMQERRDLVASWIKEEDEFLDWVLPEAGVMGFVRVKREPFGGIEAFYDRLLKDYGTYIGPGRWFERDDSFFRLGFGWPTMEDLKTGLKTISQALRG